jgi:hypothetical protein
VKDSKKRCRWVMQATISRVQAVMRMCESGLI